MTENTFDLTALLQQLFDLNNHLLLREDDTEQLVNDAVKNHANDVQEVLERLQDGLQGAGVVLLRLTFGEDVQPDDAYADAEDLVRQLNEDIANYEAPTGLEKVEVL